MYHACTGTLKGLGAPLELESQGVVSHVVWVLRTEPKSFAGASAMVCICWGQGVALLGGVALLE